MDDFLDRYKEPKLNQDQINNLNSLITSKEIKAALKSLPTYPSPPKSSGPGGFSAEF